MSVPAYVSLVTLGVADVRRAAAFYERLGWPRKESSDASDAVAFFELGNVVIGLYGHDDLAADAGVDPTPAGFRGVTLAINLATTERVDAAAESWVAAGGTLVKQPEPVFWGGYSGYVADLDGHLWEIAYNPLSPEWAAPDR